jgi:Domain of unknown function (DUF1993)
MLTLNYLFLNLSLLLDVRGWMKGTMGYRADIEKCDRTSRTHKITGRSYAILYAIPNFCFHFVMVYALLRKEGVEIGKVDYLGRES